MFLFVWTYYFHSVTLNLQILLECSDICVKLIWVLIMYVVVMTYIWLGQMWIFFYILRYCGTACVYFFLRWGSIVYSLWFVQLDFTRQDHLGNPGGISGSGPVIKAIFFLSKVTF